MLQHLRKRLIYAIGVVLGVSILVFFLVRLSGDPARLFLPPESTEEQVAAFRHTMGFDRPLPVQFLDFIAHAARGDFGQSLRHQQSAMSLVLERVPATLELSGAALLLSIVVAVPLGVVAATKRGSALDAGSLIVSLFGQSFPSFWLGIMLILIFSEKLHILPASGRGSWQHLLMPALTLAAYPVAIITRVLRSSLLDVMRQDYIRTARSKGLGERVVIYRHALRNAAIPVVTIIGQQVGALLGGAVITETIFAYPGIGLLAIQAIANRDYTVVQAFVIMMAVIIVSINFLVDVAYTLLDPRVKTG
jgi:ABC-type dipeptide/oligopeptide/nickel transport system permease component